jgi:two-component sensor histidine kinase
MASPAPLDPEGANRLALAMVECSQAPLLLLDSDFNVIAASTSFYRSFELDAPIPANRQVFKLGAGEWNVRSFRSLLKATGSGAAQVEAYEMDLKRGGRDTRSLMINARKLDFENPVDARLLVTVLDVTDARFAEKAKDDLLREKAILIQEIQHRVANSLQIIASVLLQSARRVQSDESRIHLHDAHHRVMSIAVVQKQLAASRLNDVELGPYFEQLCDSLGASMISDHDRLSIEVSTDKSAVRSDISVSLGLIVTELAINALKHAFPGNRTGKIMVRYRTRGPNWTLSVGDNGVGMPKDPARATPGLGTSIVEALARQLQARISVVDAKPGTDISIIYKQIAEAEAGPAQIAV